MATYSIKKVNNGEYKEIEKTFVLDTNKFRSKSDTLCFNVVGEENPAVFDLEIFENIMMSQIDQGFMESLEYKDGLLIATTRDGNTIKKYTYDFGWNNLKKASVEDESKNSDEHRQIEKRFVLDVDRFRVRVDTLYFNVIGEENPVVFDLSVFASNMLRQIEQGMMESLEYKDGLLVAITREGNILKKCIYDFGFSALKKVSHDSETNNREYEQIEKTFVLDIDKFRGHGDTLCFNVLGEENPTVYDLSVFVNQLVSQIDQGFVETLDFKDDFLVVTINDGNKIKKYTYDFGFGRLKNVTFGMGSTGSFDELKNLLLKIVSFYNENPNKALEELKSIIFKIVSYYNENPDHSLEELKSLMFKVVSYYNENPNREIMSKQKYIRMILDIMDGDRLPNMESKEEILRVFQVYHGNKGDILQILLDNVVFYDDNGNVLDYSSFIKARKLEAIKYDVLNQMEIKMLMFAVANNAYDLYQDYNNRTHIPRVEVEYKYVDQDGNEIEAPVEEVEAGNLLTVGRELIRRGANNVKKLALNGVQKVSRETSLVLEKIKDRGRTK